MILASASPIRKRLLNRAGIAVAVYPADLDEESLRRSKPHLTNGDMALYLARQKAAAIASRLASPRPRSISSKSPSLTPPQLFQHPLLGPFRDVSHDSGHDSNRGDKSQRAKSRSDTDFGGGDPIGGDPDNDAPDNDAPDNDGSDTDTMDNDLIIGCDQILESRGKRISKPANTQEARRQLQWMRGGCHNLFSAVSLWRNGAEIWHHTDHSRLTMHDFSDHALDAYLALETQHTTPGVCRIEGPGIQLIKDMDGDFFAILGLPMMPLLTALRRYGAKSLIRGIGE